MSISKPPVETAQVEPSLGRLRWRRRRAMLAAIFPAPLRIALFVAVAAWGLILLRGPLWIDLGASNALDTLYLGDGEGGFFEAESRPAIQAYPQADTTYRWSGPTPVIKLPWPLDAVPLKALVRLTAPRPSVAEEVSAVRLKARGKLEWADQDLGSVAVNGHYQGNFYEFKLPVHLRPNLAAYELNFEADSSFRPAGGDGRVLSLLFFGVRLEPDYAHFGWRGWLASFELPALVGLISFCCWGIGRALWPTGRVALMGEGVAGGLLLLSLVAWPLIAGPLYAPWAVILPFGWLLLALAELFHRRATELPAPFVYAATLFPLLPLSQFAFGGLYLYNVNPGSVLVGVYVGALFYVGAIYINSGRQRPRLFEQAFVRAMLIASVVAFAYDHLNVFQTNLYRGADFKVYYEALQRFQAGGPLYDLKEIINLPGAAARMPPGFTFLLWPFVNLFGSNVNVALLTWRVASEFLLIPCILILVRVFGETGSLKAAVWFFALNFEQVAESLGYGQFNVLVLLGLSLMALWIKEGRPGLAGLALAGPVGLKLYPVVSALYFLPRRNWRGLGGLGLGGLIIAGLAALTVGANTLWFYMTQVILLVNRPELDISNQSLWGFWGRLSVSRVVADYKGDVPGWVGPLSYVCVVGLVGLTAWVLWQKRLADDFGARQLKLGSLAWLGILIPPFVWFHYSVPCLVAIMALLVRLSRTDQPRPRWQLLLFALAYGVLAYGGRNDFFLTETAGLGLFGSSYRFLAALALWGLGLGLLWRDPRSDSQTQSEFNSEP